MKPVQLTIGIPCRDEGQNMNLLAAGLNAALCELDPAVTSEVIFAVNGSPAEFTTRVRDLLTSHPIARHNCRVIETPPGKLNAQKVVACERMLDGYIAFMDSDVLPDPCTLRLLVQEMERHPTCMVAYAQPVPVFPRNSRNPLHRFMRVHYTLRERTYQRRFFHGRAFILREWFWEEPHEPFNPASRSARRLALDAGPLIDDIALSRFAVARWGTGAIHEVRHANVHFDPPDSVRGLYAAALRNAYEIARLDRLYPGHASLQSAMFCNCWNSRGLAHFSRRLRHAHAAWRGFESLLKTAARWHVRLVSLGILPALSRWINVPGTKDIAHKPLKCRERIASPPARLTAAIVP